MKLKLIVLLIWCGLALGFIYIFLTVDLGSQIYTIRTPSGYVKVNGYAIIPIGIVIAVIAYFKWREEPPKPKADIIGAKK